MFAAYVRKTARLRDKGDVLVREINQYADTETPNLKMGLKQFADYLAKIEDYRQAEVGLTPPPPAAAHSSLTRTPRVNEVLCLTGGETRSQSDGAVEELRGCSQT